MNAVVELDSVHKSYGTVAAVQDLSLQLEAGEMVGLLGHNGAGKTTTIKLILGILAPSAGQVRVLGRSPHGREARRLRLQWGYLPEDVRFYEQLNGREVLEYFARLKRAPLRQCGELLEQVGLAQAADRRVRTYSKGMRQRLGLAQALLASPRLLLLDEPTVGLDPMAARDFFANIDRLRRAGTTVILSSHVLPGVEQHVDRVAILRRGTLQAWGNLEELRRAAGLPLRIRARGRWPQGFWDERLTAAGLDGVAVNGTELAIDAGPEAKLDVMRLLLATDEVDDVEVQAASLEALYVHYNREAEPTHV